MNSFCPQLSSLPSVLTSSHDYTYIYICLITCTHSYIHSVMRPCTTLKPSSLRFKGIIRSWRWCGRCRLRYQSWGVSHKAGAFVNQPCRLCDLIPVQHHTDPHQGDGSGWERAGDQPNEAARYSGPLIALSRNVS